MRYTQFEIRNYKGIERVKLELTKAPRYRINTLIGLNESGKTTVLEAIDRWSYRESLDALNLPGYAQPDVHDLIPIARRSNFNDVISIEAGVALSDEDFEMIKEACSEEFHIHLTNPFTSFTIKQSYKFSSSRAASTQPSITWSIPLRGREGRRGRSGELEGELWQNAVNVVKRFLPRIVYFPNFLFDFPDRIYLENPPATDEPKHAFYRAVLQDVLDAIGDKTNLSDHVLSRAKSTNEHDKKALQSVLLKLGAHITQTVFSTWNRIFKRQAGAKEIVVTYDKDARGAVYVQLKLKENNEYYEISERSLGFRWFFTYLLLTQYRGFRREGPKDVVFLFDEPASNLHPSAQTQLLDSFGSLPERCTVIYTTHSHHLVKPEWLDGAFVVKNEGLQYDAEDSFASRRTLINVTRYREFAVKHPQQTTYFQPVLDVLDYKPATLDSVPDVVMVEGKGDYFLLKLLVKTLRGADPLNLLPGTGAGALDLAIQLYLGWGRNFIVVLDSDSEGERQRIRYADKFGPVVASRLFTLGDLDESMRGKRLEELVVPDELLALQQSAYPEASTYNKTHFHRAVQEALVTGREMLLSDTTKGRVSRLLEMLRAKVIDAAASDVVV